MTTKHTDEPSPPPDEPYTRDIQRDESPSVAVVRTIGAMRNAPVTEIEPLAEYLDPDALDSVLARGDDVVVEFRYAGSRVTVDRRSVTVANPAGE